MSPGDALARPEIAGVPASSTALIIDPDAATRDSFGRILEELGFQTLRVKSGTEALEVFHRAHPSLVLLDVAVPDVPGLVLLRRFRSNDPTPVVVAVSAAPDVRTAVEAMRGGAADFLEKSAEPQRLRHSIERLLPLNPEVGVPARATTLAEDDYNRLFHGSAVMRKLEAKVIQVAQADGPVQIEGERGVGKAEVALAVHHLSARRGAPRVRLDCAAIPEDLLEAELFGREALTRDEVSGQPRRGKIDSAHMGTLVLEDVAELPAALQLRLVRVLKGDGFFRAGGRELVSADVRLIVTTRSSATGDRIILEELDNELGVLRLVVPPLRERREEIPRLTEEYRERFSLEFGRMATPLSGGALDLLMRYQWPGNVHELANVVKRYVVLGDERHLMDEIRARMQNPGSSPGRSRQGSAGAATADDVEAGLRQIARRAARDAERAAIEQVLVAVHWNRAEAARRLKVSYKTMLKKLGEDNFGGSRRGTRAPRGRARPA